MTRFLLVSLMALALACAVPSSAQETGLVPELTAQPEQAAQVPEASPVEEGGFEGYEAEISHEEEGGNVTLWKTLNFVLLAAGLIFLLRKPARQFFASRTEDIRKGIDEATAARKDAEARAADMERRLQGLETEIAQLREKAREEMAAEEERLRAESAHALARIRERAGQEILSTTSHARNELRAEAARLALELAEQNVRGRMTPEVASGLLNSFVNDLARIQGRTS